MRKMVWCCCAMTLAAAPALAFGHSKKIAEIEAYCKQVQAVSAFVVPFVFSGPDPWVELDEVPAAMPDQQLAFVYTSGWQVRWVFLRAVSTDEGWSEDVDYFFRDDGRIAKRVRHVQSVAANIALEVATYYRDGRVVKAKSHHRSLHPGRQDFSKFTDPDAPEFESTDDLPFPDIPDLWRRLA